MRLLAGSSSNRRLIENDIVFMANQRSLSNSREGVSGLSTVSEVGMQSLNDAEHQESPRTTPRSMFL